MVYALPWFSRQISRAEKVYHHAFTYVSLHFTAEMLQNAFQSKKPKPEHNKAKCNERQIYIFFMLLCPSLAQSK